MYSAFASWEGCCGVKEVHSFDDKGAHDFASSTPKEFLARILNYSDNQQRLLHMHFVCRKDYQGNYPEGYEWDEVRELVKQIPGVVEMGPYINGNSGNKLISYFWLNGEKCE